MPTDKRPRRETQLAATIPAESYGVGDGFNHFSWQTRELTSFKKKRRESGGKQFRFLMHAGVGSGKTLWSALVASYMLNAAHARRVFFVCPNRAIRRRVAEEYRKANIHLVRWNHGLHADAVPFGVDGYTITYQALMRDHSAIGRLCDDDRTMVIFDEIHHLGDSLSWSDAATSAFEKRAACILGLTGTPFRSDNRRIPFVQYVESPDAHGLLSFKPDGVYTLGASINDGVCRKPVAHWLKSNVRVKFPDGSVRTVDFDEDLDVQMMNRRLNGAVRAGSKSRSMALAQVLTECRRRKDRLVIFVGGDSTRKDGGGIRDASELLPAELLTLGIKPEEMCVVVSDDNLAAEKIDAFGKSDAWILVSVNMLSEGVDIPQLTAALFLTSITARSTTVQRIGRIVRGQGEAHVYMFEDPRYREIMETIEAEYRHEVDLGKAANPAEPIPGGGRGDAEETPPSIGLDCRMNGITVGGVNYSEAERLAYLRVVRDYNWPDGSAYMFMMLRLIRDGKFGPIGPDGGAA